MSFKDLVSEYQGKVNEELIKLFDKKINEVEHNSFLKLTYTNLKEYLLGGGKRLRPISLIMSFFAVSDNIDEEIIKLSLSVELLHNSTLVHDDVMDEDEFRRDKPTIHNKMRAWFLGKNKEVSYEGDLFDRVSSRFAVTNAICGGNLLYTLGLDIILGSSFDKNLLSKASITYNNSYKIVNDGQIIDNLFEFKGEISEEEYYEMIEKKTGALFLSSIQIGALLGKAAPNQYKALSDYAKLAITTFQLKDDILCITKETNKDKYGSDIRKGKKTLLIIKALENSNDAQRKIIGEVLGKDNATTGEIDQVVNVIKETGALDYVNSLAEKNIEEGKKKLMGHDLNQEAVDFFVEFADFMIKREL